MNKANSIKKVFEDIELISDDRVIVLNKIDFEKIFEVINETEDVVNISCGETGDSYNVELSLDQDLLIFYDNINEELFVDIDDFLKVFK